MNCPSNREICAAGHELVKLMVDFAKAAPIEEVERANRLGLLYFLPMMLGYGEWKILDTPAGDVELDLSDTGSCFPFPANGLPYSEMLRRMAALNVEHGRQASLVDFKAWFPKLGVSTLGIMVQDAAEAGLVEWDGPGVWITDKGGDVLDAERRRDPASALAVHDDGGQN